MSNTKKKNLRTMRLDTLGSDSHHELRLDESLAFRGRYDQLAASDHHPALTALN